MKNSFMNFVYSKEWLTNFLESLKIIESREKQEKTRTIYVNNDKPSDYESNKEPLKYVSNQVTTSKYTIINFLPKNLFEQFRRIANFYFLVNLIIIFIIPNPPTSPYTSMLPILFVVVVSAIKQGYEDILRHKADREINNSPIRVLKQGVFCDLKWKDIMCGDIVEVLADQAFPCDLLLLSSKSDDNKCFITTANLDGETNLKLRSVPNIFPEFETENDLANQRGVIEYEKPNANLYEFNGKLIINNSEFPITNENILLRGCCLRVAPKIFGIAVYTGRDTKMMRNSKFKSNKLSCIERRLNQFIVVFLVALAVLTFLCFGLSFTTFNIYTTHWYLYGRAPDYYSSNVNLYNFIILICYMNLFNYIVPLSMYVTIELQRFIGSQFIEWDKEMYDAKTDQPAKANTSDLNEDLGQIEYLFSDKTGTLTENEMEFKQFSIDGIIYEERNGELFQLNSFTPIDFMNNEKILMFLEILSFCHTVQKDETSKEKYQASSPDEFSFIKFCIKLGIIYDGDEKDPVTKKMMRIVRFKDRLVKYEILDILDFDSTRKRMSVILQNLETKKIIMYCKGAETFIIKKCVTGDFQTCLNDIENFGRQGWRTLALSMKVFSQSEYANIKTELSNAYNDILARNEKIAKSFEIIESGLTLVGATAIEDKLQEDVANTLETIRRAGIKIWVLTGDKKETAINISHSCKHFSNDMEKLIITDLKDPNEILNRLNQFKLQFSEKNSNSKRYALIIDGFTLGVLFNNDFDEKFREICMQCDAVLCCRMSPAQKAEVVKLVKQSKTKPMTAAIGDGANDVSMIQEAHVGLGIFGKEGRNAARSADFAFAKFKFVRRILLVHGYLYYSRASNLVQYFFYKNLAFVISQFYFSFFNAFSVTSLYDSMVLTFYNITLTSAPIFCFGLFEQKISIKELEATPYIYRTIKRNKNLETIQFFKWNSLAIWHSLVAFFFSYAIFTYPFSSDGKVGGSYQIGALVITDTLVIVHAKLLTEWEYKTVFVPISYFCSLAGYLIFCVLPNAIIIPSLLTSFTDYQSMYWVYFNLLSNGSIWFCFLLSIMTALLPDIVIKVIENIKDKNTISKLKYEEQQRINGIFSNNEQKGFQRLKTNKLRSSGKIHAEKEPSPQTVRVFSIPQSNISNTKVFQMPI